MEQDILVWKIIQYAGPAFCALIGTFIVILSISKIHSLELAIKHQEFKRSTTTGVITPADSVTSRLPKYITLQIGSNKVQVDKRNLINGNSLNPMEVGITAIGLLSDFPIFVKLSKEGNLLVDCTFRDFSGKIVAEMTNNEWEINPNNYFQRNYDSHGVEIIDQDGIFTLQIDLVDNNTIKLGGVIKDSYQVYFISDKTMRSWDYRLISKEEIIKNRKLVPKLFVYPAANNLGKRAKSLGI
ncbi:MAG: hypothetical protein WCE64_07910 [Bacteroidales bacterium]